MASSSVGQSSMTETIDFGSLVHQLISEGRWECIPSRCETALRDRTQNHATRPNLGRIAQC